MPVSRPGGRAPLRRTVVLASVLAVIGTFGVVTTPGTAFAESLTGSNFEIDDDANLVVDGASPAIDWLKGGSGSDLRDDVLVRDDRLTGQDDDSFTQGTNINDTPTTITTGGIPNNKSDLTHFGIMVDKQPAETYVNVFWTRVQAPSGTTTMDFEFNQSAVRQNDISPPKNPDVDTHTIPLRTVGDILVTYFLENGGTHPTLTRRTWNGTAWGTPVAFSASDALAAINTSTIPAAESNGFGELDALTFGEASMKLSAFVPSTGQCTTFGSVYLRSRSSATDTDENKDFIAPEPITISNCGLVRIHKVDDRTPAQALQGAVFTLYKDVAPIGGARGAGDTDVAGTCTTNASGDCTIADVQKGDYWAVETTTPAGYDTAPDQHVTITAGDQEVPLTFVDPVQYGTIRVIKVGVPPDGTDFSFTRDGNAFQLDDDNDGTLPSSRDFVVPIGAHTVSEVSIPSGWSLTALSCVDPTSNTTTSLQTATASINLAKNELVTCTFTNSYAPQQPPLSTQVSSAGSGTWNDTATLTGDGTHAVTGTVTFYACAPTATPTACAGGTQVGTPAAVTHVSGATYQAVTTTPYTPPGAGWTCFRAVYTSSSPYYSDASHTNDTTECFLKQNANLTVSKTAVAAFGRAYQWTIDKAVDKTRVDIAAGGNAAFTYTVSVGNSHTDNTWTVAGKITVTNPNPVPFTGVTVTDAIDNGAGSCAVTGGTNATVPASGTLVLDYLCTYSSAPSPAAGTNTATASWNATTYFTPGSSATGTASVNFATVTPSMTDEQVTVTDSVAGVLGTVNALQDPNPKTFTYTVNKAGVSGTCTDYDNTATFVTNDSTATGSSSKTVTVCVGANLTVAKSATASFARDDLWTIAKSVDQTRQEIAAGGTATFSYQVTVTPNGHVDSAFALAGTIRVTNPNDWQDIVATVTDSSNVGGGVVCAVTGGVGVTVPKSGSVDLPYTCSFTGTPSNGTNTATATWNAATYHTPAGSASGSAAVTFVKASESHATITVVDDKTDPANPVTLGTWNHADGPKTFTYSLSKSGVAGTCTSYTNTAVIVETGQSANRTVTVCVGLDLTVSKTALATDHRTYLWNLAKVVDKTRVAMDENGTARFTYTVTATPAGVTRDGWSVTGQITVTNPNDWQSITATLTDAVDGGGGSSCTVAQGVEVVVPAGGSVVRSYSCTFASQPADGLNTATATWDAAEAATPHGSATGTASVVFVPSSETNKTVTVVDDKTDPANPVVLGQATYGDLPTSFSYSVDKKGVPGACTDYTNTAVISQTQQSAQRTVTVCVGSGLLSSLTAAGGFDRAYGWTLDKVADQTLVTLPNGQSATYTYTVTATPNGFADGGFQLGGTVTATNPNTWESVVATLAVASDLGGGVVCAVTDGAAVSVPAGGVLTRPFTCTFSAAPSETGTVTATVTWDAAAAATTTSSAVGTTGVTLALATEQDKVVTVVDDMTDPANPATLGTATWGEASTTFTYSLTKDGAVATSADPACVDYTNTAVIVETEQSANEVVTLCHTFTGGGGTPVVNPPQGGGLPTTGDAIGLLARLAASLLLAGLVLLVVSRRRRTA